MKRSSRLAWMEAISDTAVGTIINLPLNFILLSITFSLKCDIFTTAIASWSLFTILAIVRKYLIRRFFHKKIC
jgi:hypothetical protein